MYGADWFSILVKMHVFEFQKSKFGNEKEILDQWWKKWCFASIPIVTRMEIRPIYILYPYLFSID
jgi:hypothetical protein